MGITATYGYQSISKSSLQGNLIFERNYNPGDISTEKPVKQTSNTTVDEKTKKSITDGCAIIKTGDYFILQNTPFVHFMDINNKIKYWDTVSVAKQLNAKYMTFTDKCFRKYVPADIKFPVSVYDKNTNNNINGGYIVMYSYNLTADRSASNGEGYQIINYEIKKTGSGNQTQCGLTGDYSAIFDVKLNQIVDFEGYKSYNNALAAAQKKINTFTTYGHPYKNFGMPINALMQTEYKNSSTWAIFNGKISGAIGISTPAQD